MKEVSNRLAFDYDDVMALIEHARGCSAWSAGYEGEASGPGLLLVGDNGVYLMSNGQPGLMRRDGKGHKVVYAVGLDPEKDADEWWERKRATFGGDDGVEHLPWADAIEELGRRLRKRGEPAAMVVITIKGEKLALSVS